MLSVSNPSPGGDDLPGGGDPAVEEFVSQILNFVDNDKTLNVVVERPVAGWKPSNPVEEGSFMLPSEGTKGLALIINIVEFDDDITNARRRYGSENDVEYLTDLLIQLDYKLYPTDQNIRERKNKPKWEIKDQIESFKSVCKQQSPQSIIVFIGSHGKHPNKFVTSDGEDMDIYEEVVYQFTQDPNFTQLKDKPKIFLVQACQSYSSTGASATTPQSPQSLNKDIYICAATTPGKASMRNVYKGSWFPYCFTYVMMKHALKMKSLQDIMKRVESMLGQIKDYQEFKQVPSLISGSYGTPLYFVKSDCDWSSVRNYDGISSLLEGVSRVCIIFTIDNQITCEKITENLGKDCILIHDWKDFRTFLCSDRGHSKEALVDVVMNLTREHFESFLLKLETINRQQIIFITDVDKKSILELNPTEYKIDVNVDPMPLQHLSFAYIEKIKERLETKYGIIINDKDLTGELLVDIISGREMFHDEIKSKRLSYYVPRTVLTRNFISDAIFEKRYSADIFLVRGIQRSHLSSIVSVSNQMTARSQDQLGKITVTFITLDNDSHFDTICENCKEESGKISKSVHMLNYENGKFRWIRTRGNLKAVQEHVAEQQEEQPEEDFCSLICADSGAPVCISDSPGMGKTILLAQIGKRLRRMFPDRTVLFVELSTFIQCIKNETKHTDEVDKNTIIKVLQNTVSKTLLGRHILESKLKLDNISIELLLDGFDEVKLGGFDFAHEILKSIRGEFPSIRLWVTSRPHKLEELEVTLGGLGYNIKPFTEIDQVNFLERFWTRYTKKLNTKRLREFASDCLKSLKRKMSSSEQDIAGIPLQCYLIGEVYGDQAHDYSKVDATSPLAERFIISSISTLYQKVIEKKVAIYGSKFGTQKSQNDTELNPDNIVNWLLNLGGKLFGKGGTPSERKQLNDAKINDLHTHLGTSLIFPDLFRKLHYSFDPLEMGEVLNVGIWELAGGLEPKVLHRTFAEYFAALFIRDKVVNGIGWGSGLSKFFMEDVLQVKVNKNKVPEFTYPVVMHFLNSVLTSDSDGADIISIPSHVVKDINDAFNVSLLSQLVYALAYADCDNILNFFRKIGVFKDPGTASSIFDKEFISCAVKHSGVEVIRFGFLHFDKRNKEVFDSDMKCELLRLAVERGQDAPVEFLINEKGLRKIVEEFHSGIKMLLHDCVKETDRKTEAEIDQRIEILRMLDGINKELKEQVDSDEEQRTPLLVESAHLQLQIELIRRGANVKAQRKSGYTILHSPYYYSSENFNKIVKQIQQTGNLEELVRMESKDTAPPLHTLMHLFDPTPETLKLFRDAGADFNFTNKHGMSVLKRAVLFGRNASTMQKLIEYGADVNYRGKDGDTLLHRAAAGGDKSVAALDFLVRAHGLNVNAKNNHGKAPLDIVLDAPYNFEMGLAIYELGGRNNNSRRASWWSADRAFDKTSGMVPFYVDMLLIHIYFFGPEIVDNYFSEFASASPHPLNYDYLKTFLTRKRILARTYLVLERLKKILLNTIQRPNPVWDQDTLDKFQAGELI